MIRNITVEEIDKYVSKLLIDDDDLGMNEYEIVTQQLADFAEEVARPGIMTATKALPSKGKK